jgi:predicted ATPase
MHLEGVSILSDLFPDRRVYPFHLPFLAESSQITFNSPITFFVGENGSGKSTLLEAITRRCGVHIWRRPQSGRVEHSQYEEELHQFLAPQWSDGPVPGSFFSASSHRDFCCTLEDWAVDDPGQLKYFGGRSLLSQSHGQSLLSLFESRYRLKGIYFSDEPETALSPRSQIRLLKIIRDMAAAGHAQFIIASHSPILLACPGAEILSFDHAPLKRLTYEETDYYQVYRDFMADRRKFL